MSYTSDFDEILRQSAKWPANSGTDRTLDLIRNTYINEHLNRGGFDV